jgi:hypothetical protein
VKQFIVLVVFIFFLTGCPPEPPHYQIEIVSTVYPISVSFTINGNITNENSNQAWYHSFEYYTPPINISAIYNDIDATPLVVIKFYANGRPYMSRTSLSNSGLPPVSMIVTGEY